MREASADRVIVAGTHMVEQSAHRSDAYAGLAPGVSVPRIGQAVCPVLHRKRIIGLQPKLGESRFERELKRGESGVALSVWRGRRTDSGSPPFPSTG